MEGKKQIIHVKMSCYFLSMVQFSSVTQSFLTLYEPTDCSMPGLPVHHQLPTFTQTHAHWVGDAIQPPHPLSSPSPPALNLSQHQCLFKWVSSSHQVAKLLEFQLQCQSFQWIFRINLLYDFFLRLLCEKETESQWGLSWRNQGSKTEWNTLPYLVDVLAGQRFHRGLLTPGVCLLKSQGIA